VFNKNCLLILLILCSVQRINAQQVYERNSNQVFNFLSTMSQKGYIEWDDLIYPITKEKIKVALVKLNNSTTILNSLEQKELKFYLKEYLNQRPKLFYKSDSSFSIHIDPIFSGGIQKGKISNYIASSIGASLWGNIGKNLGYQFSFQDINLKGTQFDTAYNSITEENARGVVALNDPNIGKQLNYTDLRASLIYKFKKGLISFGQDALSWGYGENGQLVLSNKAPYYPYIKIDYQPLNWLSFNYTHAFLQSNMIDSTNSYPIPSRIFPALREVYIKKYMASHSIDIRIKKGLNLSIGESIIYNDQLQIGYLLPIMFFKAYDNFINRGIIQAGSNGQFFGQLSTKNLIVPKSQFYTTLFIDEIRVSSIFDPVKARNQVGVNLGFIKQDFLLPNLMVGFEYTRLNPFLYRNFLPAQNYTSNGYLLGDWMGSNSDKLLFFVKYSPVPRLKTALRYQEIRKGPIGTMQEQYFGQPQMPFMPTVLNHQKNWLFEANYEYTHRFVMNLSLNAIVGTGIQSFIGFSYGL